MSRGVLIQVDDKNDPQQRSYLSLPKSFDIGEILLEARTRWLNPPEIIHILHHHDKFKVVPNNEQLNKPHGGTLFLYGTDLHYDYRPDGYWWREGYATMVDGAPEPLQVQVAVSENAKGPTILRRKYWMIGNVLVHYRYNESLNQPGDNWRSVDHEECCLHELSFQWRRREHLVLEREAPGLEVLYADMIQENPLEAIFHDNEQGDIWQHLFFELEAADHEVHYPDTCQEDPRETLSRDCEEMDESEPEASHNAVLPEPEVSNQAMSEQWKVGKSLGFGSCGEVHRAFNRKNGKFCAIKTIKHNANVQGSEKLIEAELEEINRHKGLRHPNIVRLYGSEKVNGEIRIYLEYVPYGSLGKLLREYGYLEEPVIRNYTAQIVAGLDYLHKKKTVHRDVKAENILVCPNGEVKLADFGFAKLISSTNPNALSTKGTVFWMAPEVIMGNKNETGHHNLLADIWSLGCTIIEMATGKHPWHEHCSEKSCENLFTAMFKIGRNNDTPKIPECLSDDGKHFLQLCLQRDPARRPTAAKLMDHPFIKNCPAL